MNADTVPCSNRGTLYRSLSNRGIGRSNTEREGRNMFIIRVRWGRDDWRNAGEAYRSFCLYCDRISAFDVTQEAAEKAAKKHVCPDLA